MPNIEALLYLCQLFFSQCTFLSDCIPPDPLMAFISSSLGLTVGPCLAGMIRFPEAVVIAVDADARRGASEVETETGLDGK